MCLLAPTLDGAAVCFYRTCDAATCLGQMAARTAANRLREALMRTSATPRRALRLPTALLTAALPAGLTVPARLWPPTQPDAVGLRPPSFLFRLCTNKAKGEMPLVCQIWDVLSVASPAILRCGLSSQAKHSAMSGGQGRR